MAQAVFIEAYAAGPRVRDEMDAALKALETLLAEALRLAPRPVAGTTHLAAGLVAGIVGTIRKTARTGKAEELPGLTDELDRLDAFGRPRGGRRLLLTRGRDPPTGRPAADSLRLARVQACRAESVADAGRRAITTTARLAAAERARRTDQREDPQGRRPFPPRVRTPFRGRRGLLPRRGRIGRRRGGARRRVVRCGGWRVGSAASSRRSARCARSPPEIGELSRLVLLDVTAPGRPGLLRREEMVDRAVGRGSASRRRRTGGLRSSPRPPRSARSGGSPKQKSRPGGPKQLRAARPGLRLHGPGALARAVAHSPSRPPTEAAFAADAILGPTLLAARPPDRHQRHHPSAVLSPDGAARQQGRLRGLRRRRRDPPLPARSTAPRSSARSSTTRARSRSSPTTTSSSTSSPSRARRSRRTRCWRSPPGPSTKRGRASSSAPGVSSPRRRSSPPPTGPSWRRSTRAPVSSARS